MKLNAVKFKQDKFSGYLTCIKTSIAAEGADWPIQGSLDGFFVIDQRTEKNPQGYQRPANKKRYSDFGEFLNTENGFCPSAIICNVRKDNDGEIKYKGGEITLPNNSKIYVCEGQHRLLGYIFALKVYGLDYDIPFVLLNEIASEEMVHFYLINQKQKSVATDLAEINLKAYQDETNRMIPGAKFTAQKDVAISITKKLNETPTSPFYRSIQVTGETNKKTTIKATTFHNAVEEVVKEAEKIWADHDQLENQVYDILFNAWRAIKGLMPQSFNEPKKYVALKSSGIFVLNRVISYSLNTMINRKLKGSLSEQDYHLLFTNDEVKQYFTDDWWESGQKAVGAASFGSSQGSFRRIQLLITQGINAAFRSKDFPREL